MPREVLECVAFIYAKYAKIPKRREPQPVGTVFFIKWPDEDSPNLEWSYAVMARHVIDDIKHTSADDIVYLRLNRRDRQGVKFIPINAKYWLCHPESA